MILVAAGLCAIWLGAVWVSWGIGLFRSPVLQSSQSMALSRQQATREAESLGWEDTTRSILVIRPCAGNESDLRTRLLSSQDLSVGLAGALVLRFAVASRDDPAFDVCVSVANQLRTKGLDAQWVVTGASGPNRKVAQLAAVTAAREKADDVVVVVDSDVDLTGFDLSAMLAPLARDKKLGAVWAPPVDAGSVQTWGDRCSHAILNGSFHAFPFLCGLDPTGLVGKTFAIRGEALRGIGCFTPLGDYLGEDFELSRRLRLYGYRVEPASTVARSMAQGRTIGSVALRFARWIIVVRAQRKVLLMTYPFFVFPVPLLIVGIATIATLAPDGIAALAVVLAVGVWGSRVRFAAVARRLCGVRTSLIDAWVDALLSDLLLLVAFVLALKSRKFEWRGVSLMIAADGRLQAGAGGGDSSR